MDNYNHNNFHSDSLQLKLRKSAEIFHLPTLPTDRPYFTIKLTIKKNTDHVFLNFVLNTPNCSFCCGCFFSTSVLEGYGSARFPFEKTQVY